MDHIPSTSPRKLIRVLEKAGFVIQRQVGSHVHLRHTENGLITRVPMHNKDLSRGFLKAILKQAGISTDEFKKLL